uniref:hypothetical protein n=1 Tax=Limnobacter sp. TaxID=2003368 RepID=UPI00258822CA
MTLARTFNTFKFATLGVFLAISLAACNSGSNDTANAAGGTVTASETGGGSAIIPSQVAQNT